AGAATTSPARSGYRRSVRCEGAEPWSSTAQFQRTKNQTPRTKRVANALVLGIWFLVIPYDVLIWICFCLADSALGRRPVSTPCLHSAEIGLLSIDSWMVKAR